MRKQVGTFVHRFNCAFPVLAIATILALVDIPRLMGLSLSRSTILGGRVDLILPVEAAVALAYAAMSWSPSAIIGQSAATRITAFAVGAFYLPAFILLLPRDIRHALWSFPSDEATRVVTGSVGMFLLPPLAARFGFRRADLGKDEPRPNNTLDPTENLTRKSGHLQ